jgi:hypothetical protein
MNHDARVVALKIIFQGANDKEIGNAVWEASAHPENVSNHIMQHSQTAWLPVCDLDAINDRLPDDGEVYTGSHEQFVAKMREVEGWDYSGSFSVEDTIREAMEGLQMTGLIRPMTAQEREEHGLL